MTPTESGNTAPASLSRDAITRIRALAEKACPGPWTLNGDTILSNQSHPIATLSHPRHRLCWHGTGKDGEYIAALDPATVIALCDLAEKANPEPAQAQVTEAEVEAACVAAYSACDMGPFPQMAVDPVGDRRFVRAALESARLSAPLPDGRS